MILYRERAVLRRPPEIIAAALTDAHGPPVGDDGAGGDTGDADGEGIDDADPDGNAPTGEAVREWRSAPRLGVGWRATLHPVEGQFRVALVAPDAYRQVALSALPAVPAAVAVAAGVLPPAVLPVPFLAYAAVATLPGVHHLPGGPTLPAPPGVETVARRPTPVALPAYVFLAAAAWAWLSARGGPVAGAGAGLALLAVGAAHAGAGLDRDPGADGGAGPDVGPDPGGDADHDRGVTAGPGAAAEATAAGGVPGAGVVLAGVVPALLSATNALVADRLLAGDSGPTAGDLWVVLGAAVLVDAAFLLFCRRAVAELSGVRVAPVRSRALRVGTLLAVAAANLALLAVALGGVRGLVGPAGPLRATLPASVAGPGASAAVGAVGALLLLPSLSVAAAWVHGVLDGIAALVWGLVRSRPVDAPAGVPDGVAVRVAGTDLPVARPVGLPGRPVVLVGAPLWAALDDAERGAVIAHEAYHLVDDDPTRGPAVAALGAVAGGPNAVRALYDRRAVERRADAFAADRVGADSFVRALRTVTRVRAAGGTGAGQGPGLRADGDGDDPGETGTATTGRLRRAVGRVRAALARSVPGGPVRTVATRVARTLFAPYALYVGPGTVESHDPVDRRIARVLGR